MTICWECDFSQYEGALFCSECGAYLHEAGKIRLKGTARLPFTTELDDTQVLQLVGQELSPNAEAQQIRFIIPASRRQVTLPLQTEILIGRVNADDTTPPRLDLTPDGAIEHGVSRTHATIQRSDEGIMLLDLGSTNGTILNGYQLPPDLPYLLRSGAEVRFGHLLVHIFFE